MVDEGCAYRNQAQPHPRDELDRGLADVAGRQAGVSAGQLRRIGLSKAAIARRVRKGVLHPLHRGVYAVGHTALTRRGREWAAVLAGGPDAVLSHTTAGAFWTLMAPEKTIEVTTPRALRPRTGLVLHRTRRLDPVDAPRSTESR